MTFVVVSKYSPNTCAFPLASNPRAAASYGSAYQRQEYRWPYNYNYNIYHNKNYNYQNGVTNRLYNGEE